MFKVYSLGLRDYGSGCRVKRSVFWAYSSGFIVEGSGLRVEGLVFRV